MAQLPGRDERLRETPHAKVASMIDPLIEALEPLQDQPIAFFGHSMGGLIAWELMRAMRARKLPLPVHFFPSARPAPHVPEPGPHLHPMPDTLFIDVLQKHYGGIPQEILREKQLLALFLPALRADFELVETHEYRAEAPLSVPFTAFAGIADPLSPPFVVEPWREHTNRSFQMHIVHGDHFFLQSERETLTERIIEALL
jgi:surfactin synthase thioesterase subunit